MAFDDLEVTCTLRNIGEHAGAETLQLYVEHLQPTETMPLRQLKAFAKCTVAAGSDARVTLCVPGRAFAWYDVDVADWTVSPGRYRLHIGTSSRDLALSHDIEIVA